MNTSTVIKSLVACVAATAVSIVAGCSAAKPTDQSSSPALFQQLLERHEDGVDNLMANSSANEETADMATAAQLLGLQHVYSPNQAAFDQGMIGVAPLGIHCVVLIGASANTSTTGTATVTVMARYNNQVIFFNADGEQTLDRLKPFIDKWREACGQNIAGPPLV